MAEKIGICPGQCVTLNPGQEFGGGLMVTGALSCKSRRRWLPGPAMAAVILLWLPTAAAGADTVYECVPSGFSLGLAPISRPSDLGGLYDQVWPMAHADMQNLLAEQLYKSALFSHIAVFTDGPHPEMADLSLLVTIPIMRELSGGVYPLYELSVDVMLTENTGGYILFVKTYQTQFASALLGLPAQERFKSEILIGFAGIIPGLMQDLNYALNEDPDPAFADLKRAKTVVHAHLEPLWLLPTIVAEDAPGLQNYSRFIGEQLRTRLTRKNCFAIQEVPDSMKDCMAASIGEGVDGITDIMRRCPSPPSIRGMMVISFLTSKYDSMRLRSVLVYLPKMAVLYDRSIATSSGWQLGNTIETHAAGIAQAAHSVPH